MLTLGDLAQNCCGQRDMRFSRSTFVRVVALATALAGLSGCVSPEDLRPRDEATCRTYGFRPGTTDFANCVQREIAMRRDAGSDWWGPHW
jgi:hypothetical protein